MKISEAEDLLNQAFRDNPLGSKLDPRPMIGMDMRPSASAVLIQLHHALVTMGIMQNIKYKLRIDTSWNMIVMEATGATGAKPDDVTLAKQIASTITTLIRHEIVLDPEEN